MKINQFKYFYPEKPTLTLMENIHQFGLEWIAEPKYKGSRLQLHIIDGKPLFYSRHGYPLVYNKDPDKGIVAELREKFPRGYYLFDGELRHNKVIGIRNKIVLWDCFIYENELLNKMTYYDRLIFVDSNFTNTGTISRINRYVNCFSNDYFKSVYNDYISGKYGNSVEFEGIVLKRLDGMLNLGSTRGLDSRWMFKIRKPSNSYKF